MVKEHFPKQYKLEFLKKINVNRLTGGEKGGIIMDQPLFNRC